MTNSISVESLSVVYHSSIPVVTTELLSKLYGTDAENVKKNFARNAERFTEGKHYFKLTGDELRAFKHKVTNCPFVKVAGNVRHLMLWTERGAARHAKMLETDQAWEVFEMLEDCYFCQQSDVESVPVKKRSKPAIALQHPSTLDFEIPEPVVIVEGCAISQLNALFGTVEFLGAEMWPHLRALFPLLDKQYAGAFDTALLLLSLLKETRHLCHEQTNVISIYNRER